MDFSSLESYSFCPSFSVKSTEFARIHSAAGVLPEETWRRAEEQAEQRMAEPPSPAQTRGKAKTMSKKGLTWDIYERTMTAYFNVNVGKRFGGHVCSP